MLTKHSCPIEQVSALFGDHCSLLIVRDLLAGPRRFSELGRSLAVSSRTLTIKLRALEQNGFVTRRAASYPAGHAYALTSKGRALRRILDMMRAYGKRYLA